MKILRTPDERFEKITDFPYKPHYTNGIENDVLEMCPNAKSAPQIGGGHFYQWTRPKELSDLIINFIKEN